MSERTSGFIRMASLVGPAVTIQDMQGGWPALASIEADGDVILTAIYFGGVQLTHRNSPGERRLQNPGKNRPILEIPGRKTVLVGLWDRDPEIPVTAPVLVIPEASRRIGRRTRWSAFVSVDTLVNAANNAWATQTTTSNERLTALHAELLPLAIGALVAGVHPDEREVQAAVRATGHLEPIPDGPGPADEVDRLRRVVSALIRDARFSGNMLNAYGRLCAMCGLGLGLVQGAHIYPASAPGSSDAPTNGIALCANHHVAFDRHQIAIFPTDLRLLIHPEVLDRADGDPVATAFIASTFDHLQRPHHGLGPDPRMLTLRYGHFANEYAWAGL